MQGVVKFGAAGGAVIEKAGYVVGFEGDAKDVVDNVLAVGVV